MTTEFPPHPAKFSPEVLDAVTAVLGACPDRRVLDPFAGIGTVHRLPYRTVAIELEPEWARAHPLTIVGDALALPFADERFDAVVTSPCYGNRMADHHDARDASVRHTYRHYLGRALSPNNAGSLQWGDQYRAFHGIAWREAHRILRSDGLLLVVVSDHVRAGVRQRIVDWHLGALVDTGFLVEQVTPIPTRRLRHGANGEARVRGEKLLVVRR